MLQYLLSMKFNLNMLQSRGSSTIYKQVKQVNIIFCEFEVEASLHEYERIQICGQNIIFNYYFKGGQKCRKKD